MLTDRHHTRLIGLDTHNRSIYEEKELGKIQNMGAREALFPCSLKHLPISLCFPYMRIPFSNQQRGKNRTKVLEVYSLATLPCVFFELAA